MSTALLLLGVVGCQSPEDLTPSVSRAGINSLTASFPDDDSDENVFSSEIDYNSHVITVVVPYNYPLTSYNVVTMDMLSKMRVKANLDDNVYLTPGLLYMDLSKENMITITDQSKKKSEYKVVAEIRKSAQCLLTKYNIPSAGLSGVIDDVNNVVSLITLEDLGEATADITVSHGATITPDPSQTAINHDVEFELTVTAQNGVNKKTYTVKKAIPEKTELGMRANSRKLMFAKKLVDIGIPSNNNTTGLAVVDNYVVINTRAQNSVYIDGKTGEVAGTMDISSIMGGVTNFYHTSDDNGNILICNLTQNAGPTFTIWKKKGIDGALETYIQYPTDKQMGRKISIAGSLDGDAIITAGFHNATGTFARWQVVGGQLVSQTPDIVTATGLAWTTNIDLIYTDGNNTSSNYFVAPYGAPYKFTWMNGDNTIKLQGDAISSNWIVNAVDYTVFNSNPYVLHNSVNSFSWGSDDNIYLYDMNAGSFSSRIDVCEGGIYGAKALGTTNGNGTGDVIFKVSDDGYYLYVYFMFTNGYVVGVQYDCIKM